MDPKEITILEEIGDNFNANDPDVRASFWQKEGTARLYFQWDRTRFGYLEIREGKVSDRNLKMGGSSRQILKDYLASKNIPNTL